MPRDKPSGDRLKTEEARRAEAGLIRAQLSDLGFPEETLAPIDDALTAFARHGVGYTGTHRMRDLGVAVHLLLSTQARVVSYARVGRV